MYRRRPSAWIVSKASELLPDPLTPVRTTSRSRGMSTSTSRRLWTRTPRSRMDRPDPDLDSSTAIARRPVDHRDLPDPVYYPDRPVSVPPD